jgi:murein DD-endopeptidase MepM/ murein hydrolase activator NlpD
MKRILLVGLLALAASAGAAHADTWVVLPTPALPGTAPNEGNVPMPADLSAKPAVPQQLTIEQLRTLWEAAGAAYGVPWAVLGAINKIETNFGQNMGPSSAGAVGWMQFMPSTWLRHGTDGNGDGLADPWNAEDAIYSAARYLAAAGAEDDLRRAVFAYNHADWYVEDVLNLAAVYETGGSGLALSLPAAEPQVDLSGFEQRVADAEAALGQARALVQPLLRSRAERLAQTERAELVSDRLDGEREAAEIGVQLAEQRQEIERLVEELEAAEAELAAARSGSVTSGFAPGTGYLASAPSFREGWVFPVGGGPELVSVAHSHHDYPAADIAAPAGSPVYALADATVKQSWPEPEERCGIGATVVSGDGRTWTYCHLAYLDAAVVPGAQLAAGAFMGLVGTTGRSTGPHLHLQLQPPTAYPQAEQWFGAFAGYAFRWQDGGAEASDWNFAVTDESTGLNSAPAFAER